VTANLKLHTRDLGGNGDHRGGDRCGLRGASCGDQKASGSRVRDPGLSGELEARVARKLRARILPFVILLYFISFLDRVNVALPPSP